MRNEFAQLHIRDEKLDEFFTDEGFIEQANRAMAQTAAGRSPIAILPQEIEDVAERLKVLANEIPVERTAPKPLAFSVDQVAPKDPRVPFAFVVTIRTDEDHVDGYVATEFNGRLASIATDFAGSKLVMGIGSEDEAETIGNKPLRNYLTAHSTETRYVLEIGSSPFMPSTPIHIMATSNSAFSVSRVLFFEK
jgi:hypothetical protein